MPRRDIDQAGARQRLGHAQAIAVHRMAVQHRTMGQKDVPCIDIARILHIHPGARPAQQHRDQIERVLRADGNQQILRFRTETALRQDAADDLLDQHGIVGIDMVRHPVP